MDDFEFQAFPEDLFGVKGDGAFDVAPATGLKGRVPGQRVCGSRGSHQKPVCSNPFIMA